MNSKQRISIAILSAAAALGTSAWVFAETPAKPACEGKHGEHGQGQGRFKKADTNGDGFLTQAEVGDARWARIQIADANGDGKISQAEMQQAHKDGKLPHHGQGPKS